MEKKTMGEFISVLRKANGLTQQEVADRLNVSNKAVSRWERDECAPDITLIPALAEMFQVTCDELLKGERINKTVQREKTEPKVEKQLKAVINRTISGFKNLIWISLALSAVGLICMFGISYGFYRPVIGFAVMLLFEAAAFTVAAIAVNKMKESKTDNELLENAEESLLNRYDHCLGTFSFHAFFAVFSVILLSLPLVMFTSDYVESVLAIDSYFLLGFSGAVLILALVYLKTKEPYCKWITEQERKEKVEKKSTIQKMNRLQIGAVVLAGVLFVAAPFFENGQTEMSPLFGGTLMAGLLFLVADIICFLVFIIRYREKEMLLPGIRNMLFIPAGYWLIGVHNVSYVSEFGWSELQRYTYWDMEYLFYAIGWAAFITLLFTVAEHLIKKNGYDKIL